MASPQKENGYTGVANEILEELSKRTLPPDIASIVFVVWRKTYGWNKKSDRISLSQFMVATHLSEPHCFRAIKRALDTKIILRKGEKRNFIYWFNKDWETWTLLARSGKYKEELLARTGLPLLARSGDYKRNIKQEELSSPKGSDKFMAIRQYNENDFADDGLPSLDADSGKKIKDARPKKAGPKVSGYWNLVHWAEERRGAKFPSWKLQIKAIASMVNADLKDDDIKDRWVELEDDKWQKDKLDFFAVARSFDKNPASKKANPLLYAKR